ncbi:MAG: NAD(P)-binding domain-containing protein, partial [Candidatus Micrarchaeaceae archaeon]
MPIQSGQFMREIGIIGIGDMGSRMAERLHGSGFSLVLYDRTASRFEKFKGMEGVGFAENIPEFVKSLKRPGGYAAVLVMLPGG